MLVLMQVDFSPIFNTETGLANLQHRKKEM